VGSLSGVVCHSSEAYPPFSFCFFPYKNVAPTMFSLATFPGARNPWMARMLLSTPPQTLGSLRETGLPRCNLFSPPPFGRPRTFSQRAKRANDLLVGFVDGRDTRGVVSFCFFPAALEGTVPGPFPGAFTRTLRPWTAGLRYEKKPRIVSDRPFDL